MSSRVLRKLQGGRDAELKARHGLKEEGDDVGGECEEEDEEETPKAKINPFDLLTQSMSESEVKEDDNETENASNPAAGDTTNETKQKKKKRRKKKANYKQSGSQISSEDNEVIEKLTKNLKPKLHKIRETSLDQNHADKPSTIVDKTLLAIEVKHLNPQNEMRRTFGKHVVKTENKRGRQKMFLKNTFMVQPKDTWPQITKNIISMKPVDEPDANASISKASSFLPGIREHWFAFEHSQYYQNAQYVFLTALEGSDSDFLISLIRRCPYHIDSLIQLSELCKMTEDYALAAEFIERAVFVLEHALHPSFSLTSGSSRLDYRRQENRAFFVVLFKYAMYLEARACCRTAFEISKLILTLSPDVDPLAMVLVIDYYAIRSKQYSWMVNFYEQYNTLRNLSQLPNMAYSYALALFCLGNDMEKTDQALQYALLMFPGVLKLLLEELSIQPDKKVLNSTYFDTDISTNLPPALNQLVVLYVARAKVIWRQADILPWLERNVNIALEKIAARAPEVIEYSQKRASRYIKPPRPILRHIILADEKVPISEFVINESNAIVAYDPLPPVDSISGYQKKPTTSSSSTATDGENRNRISIFFQSILPSYVFEQQQQRQQQIAAENQAALEQFQENNGDPAGVARFMARMMRDRGVVEAAAARRNPPLEANNEGDAAANQGDLNRRLDELVNDFEGAVGPREGGNDEPSGSSYRELTQSFAHLVDSMRDFLSNGLNNEENDNQSAGEDSTDNFD